MAKLFERAQLRQDVLVSALGRADCPRAADILGSGGQCIVGALAVDASDRMDGRKVQHVEPHAGQVRQPRLDVAERAVMTRLDACRARKHFVPAAETRTPAVRHQFQSHRRGEAPVRIARKDVRARRIQCHRLLCAGIGAGVGSGRAQLRRPFGEDRRVAARGPNGNFIDEAGADQQGHANVRLDLAPFELVPP